MVYFFSFCYNAQYNADEHLLIYSLVMPKKCMKCQLRNMRPRYNGEQDRHCP